MDDRIELRRRIRNVLGECLDSVRDLDKEEPMEELLGYRRLSELEGLMRSMRGFCMTLGSEIRDLQAPPQDLAEARRAGL